MLSDFARALVFRLLALSELLHFLRETVDGLLRLLLLLLLLLASLHLFVLIAQLFLIQLEQVGEILRALLTGTTTTASTTALLNRDVTEHRFGVLELGERALLGAACRSDLLCTDSLLGRVHHRGRFRQNLRDLRVVRVAAATPRSTSRCASASTSSRNFCWESRMV